MVNEKARHLIRQAIDEIQRDLDASDDMGFEQYDLLDLLDELRYQISPKPAPKPQDAKTLERERKIAALFRHALSKVEPVRGVPVSAFGA